MPFAKVCEVLAHFGKVSRGEADYEVYFESATVANVGIIVGNEVDGVRGVGFKNPHFDQAFRDLIWSLMREFSCTVYDGLLREVQVAKGHKSDLTSAFAQHGVREISAVCQLWPDRLLREGKERVYPALRYTNRIAGAPNVQFFDHLAAQNTELQLDVELVPAACNPLTLRVLKNISLHIDHGLTDNLTLQAGLRFIEAEVGLQFVESPPVATLQNQIKIISPFPGNSNPINAFQVDFEVVEEQAKFEAQLRAFLKQKHGVEIDYDASGIKLVLKLLSQLHAEYLRRSIDPAADAEKNAQFVGTWAQLLGAYFGNYLRFQLGGQWGAVARRSNQVYVLQSYRGRCIFPQLLVLDHIVNGESASIALALQSLGASDQSACARSDDLVCKIPEFCGLIQTRHNTDASFKLALGDELNPAHFDFSLASLKWLDTYVLRLRAARETIDEKALIDTCIAIGAYLGETVRRNAQVDSPWRWFTYDDYALEHPDFAQRRERHLSTLLILDGAESTCYPLGTVMAMVQSSNGDEHGDCSSFVAQLLASNQEDLNSASGLSSGQVRNAHAGNHAAPVSTPTPYVPERASTRAAANATSTLFGYLPFLLCLLILGLSFQEAWTAHKQVFLQLPAGKRVLLRAWIGLPALYLGATLLLNKRRFMYDASLLMAMIISLFASYALYGMNDVKVKYTGDYAVFLWLPLVQFVFIFVWLRLVQRHKEGDDSEPSSI